MDVIVATAVESIHTLNPSDQSAQRTYAIGQAMNTLNGNGISQCTVRVGTENGELLYSNDGAPLAWDVAVGPGERYYALQRGRPPVFRTLSTASGMQVECLWSLEELYAEFGPFIDPEDMEYITEHYNDLPTIDHRTGGPAGEVL